LGGGPAVFIDRSELCGLTDELKGESDSYNRDHTLDLTPDTLIGKSDSPTGVILDAGGYVLRLKGGVNSESGTPANESTNVASGTFETPYAPFQTKRMRTTYGDSSLTSNGSQRLPSENINKNCDDVEFAIAATRQIIVDMVRETKIGRRWAESLNIQLDEIMIGNRRLSRTGSKILGCWEEQMEELRSTHMNVKDLHCDIGSLREQLKPFKLERDEATALLAATQSVPPPPPDFINVDDDHIVFLSPSGKKYATSLKRLRAPIT